MTAEHLTATVAVPISKTDPSAVKYEEIPLPPREMWEDGQTTAPAPEDVVPPAAAADLAASAPVEALDFIGDAHRRVVPLKHPFRYAGREVHEIVIQRLKLGELETVLQRRPGEAFSLFDFYARMSGLPAAVLRGMIDEDGDAVTSAAYDFLPRSLRTEGD